MFDGGAQLVGRTDDWESFEITWRKCGSQQFSIPGSQERDERERG